jgi:hypothetical protein
MTRFRIREVAERRCSGRGFNAIDDVAALRAAMFALQLVMRGERACVPVMRLYTGS